MISKPQKLGGGDTQTDEQAQTDAQKARWSHKPPLIFQNKEIKLKKAVQQINILEISG
jgi:hypothetical protein